jgi:hypothetical protein
MPPLFVGISGPKVTFDKFSLENHKQTMDDSNTVKQEDSEGPDWHPANVQAALEMRRCRSQVYRRRTATMQLRWRLYGRGD